MFQEDLQHVLALKQSIRNYSSHWQVSDKGTRTMSMTNYRDNIGLQLPHGLRL